MAMSESVYKIDNVFNQIKKKLKISEFYDLNLNKIWKEATGDLISQVSMPIHLEEGVLTVNVRDTIWVNELNLLKREIINRINENLGKEMLKDIRYKVGIVKFKENVEHNDNFFNLRDVRLTKEDLNMIESAISLIEDEELREKFRKLFIVSLKRKYLYEKKGKK